MKRCLVCSHLYQTIFLLAILVCPQVRAQYAPPTNGLVGWWRAEGNGNDSSGNGHNGTLLNGGGYDLGKIGQAFSFLGNPNRLFIPDSADLNLTNSLSIAAWIYPKASSVHVLEGSPASGFVTYTFAVWVATYFYFGITSQSGSAVLTFPLTFNQWKHVTGTL